MKYASAFAGIGGFDLGFDRAGMTNTMQIEWDRHCHTILDRHFPDHKKAGDISDVSGTDLGDIDIFVGGFPCQDTSTAAPNRAGLAGSRSGYFSEFVRLLHEYLTLVDAARPRWVVIENPVGLLASPGLVRAPKGDGIDRRGWDMAAVVRGLEDLGYGWSYRVVDGRYLGTPQKRERVIVVGHRGGDSRPAWQVLGDEGAGGQVDPAPRVRTRRPRAAVSAETDSGVLIWRKSARPRKSLALGGYETWVPDDYSNTLAGSDGGLATRQTHLLVQNERVRTLSLTEWERLQGFPDDWTLGVPESARFQMLGNAMHVGMASWLAQRLLAVHDSVPFIRPDLEVIA